MNYWFPYKDVRKYQEQMMDLIQKSLVEKKHCLIRAPTGLGKTISALSVVLKFAKENNLKVIYLTNRTTGQTQPLKEFQEIQKKFSKDNKLFGGRIISKRDLCLLKEVKELESETFYTICERNKDKICKFYKNYKKHVLKDNEILKKIIGDDASKFMDIFALRDDIKKYCPYYSIKKYLQVYADFILLDYNYMLSPFIRKGFFDVVDLSKCIVIFDECHSLPNKCQELSSIKVSTNIFLACIDEMNDYRKKYIEEKVSERNEEDIEKEINETIGLVASFGRIVRDIIANRRKNEIPFDLKKITELSKKEDYRVDKSEIKNSIEVLSYFSSLILEDKKKSRCFSLVNFLKLLLDVQEDEKFIQFIEIKNFNKKRFSYLNIHCLDPSYLFKDVLENSYNVIGFSGTLFLEEFKKLMNFPEDTVSEDIQSPFTKDQRKVLIFPKDYANFTLKTRNENVDFKSNQMIKIINSMKGNVLVVFPSTDVFNIYVPKLKDKLNKVVYLRPFSDDYLDSDDYRIQRNDILNSFKEEDNAVLFSIAFGSYNEGVDFIGCLQNVIVVGFPYPGITYKRKCLEDFFAKKFNDKDYAKFLTSMLPGLEKSIQSAGRPIRSFDDKAVVVFYGKQFGPGTWKYHKFINLFPVDLKEHCIITTEFSDLIKEIESFKY